MDRRRSQDSLFGVRLTGELEYFLSDTNPWWQQKPLPPLPSFRRWLFDGVLQRLKSGLAPVTVIRGPRQVGKTTLQQQIIEHLLEEEAVDPKRIFRAQFDEIPSLRGVTDPILTLCRWYEQRILGGTLNEWARKGEPAYIFFDEVQNLGDWAPQVKALVDHHAVRVLLTGSSALRIEQGRDSLAGRMSTLELGTLLLREICALRGWGDLPPLLAGNGLRCLEEKQFWETLREQGLARQEARDRAFAAFSERGGYPIAQARTTEPSQRSLSAAAIRSRRHVPTGLGRKSPTS